MLGSISRFSNSKFSKLGLNSLVSFMSTGAKYMVYQVGKVYTGVAEKATTTITLTFKYTYDNSKVLNMDLHDYLGQQMLALQEKNPDASVTGVITGDYHETMYHTDIAGDVSSSGYDGESGGMF